MAPSYYQENVIRFIEYDLGICYGKMIFHVFDLRVPETRA